MTYADMKSITRSKSGDTTDKAAVIYEATAAFLDKIEKRPIRLIGIRLSGLTSTLSVQTSLFEAGGKKDNPNQDKLDAAMLKLQRKHGRDVVKTGNELPAEKRVQEDFGW